MRKTVGLIAVIFLLMLCGMAAAEVAAQDNQYWEEGRIPVTGNAGGRISAKSDIFTGSSLMNAGSEGETLPAPANVHWKRFEFFLQNKHIGRNCQMKKILLLGKHLMKV